MLDALVRRHPALAHRSSFARGEAFQVARPAEPDIEEPAGRRGRGGGPSGDRIRGGLRG
ncbi:hypothetical protein G5V59_10400 [Nocardioides sp. W3-2-3]|uniref:hypothetical protein n=1 Tax=Nocardioides convexus TaxID=2712224 RepID=UPI0024189FEB|nr:hypothetical protein [Nocardioides convexus]NHA00367.1 hypothetical protein [Nocardioides convexus]